MSTNPWDHDNIPSIKCYTNKDLSRQAHFYQEILGWKALSVGKSWALLKKDSGYFRHLWLVAVNFSPEELGLKGRKLVHDEWVGDAAAAEIACRNMGLQIAPESRFLELARGLKIESLPKGFVVDDPDIGEVLIIQGNPPGGS